MLPTVFPCMLMHKLLVPLVVLVALVALVLLMLLPLLPLLVLVLSPLDTIVIQRVGCGFVCVAPPTPACPREAGNAANSLPFVARVSDGCVSLRVGNNVAMRASNILEQRVVGHAAVSCAIFGHHTSMSQKRNLFGYFDAVSSKKHRTRAAGLNWGVPLRVAALITGGMVPKGVP